VQSNALYHGSGSDGFLKKHIFTDNSDLKGRQLVFHEGADLMSMWFGSLVWFFGLVLWLGFALWFVGLRIIGGYAAW
jgi:hypothetical protein